MYGRQSRTTNTTSHLFQIYVDLHMKPQVFCSMMKHNGFTIGQLILLLRQDTLLTGLNGPLHTNGTQYIHREERLGIMDLDRKFGSIYFKPMKTTLNDTTIILMCLPGSNEEFS